MTATFGPGLWDSSPSDILTWSLESRYRRLTASLGSTLYELTWKPRATPAGRWIPAQRASARPTLVSVSTGALCALMGWPTPTANPANGTPEAFLERKRRSVDRGSSMGISLTDIAVVAQLAGWPTPQKRDFRSGMENRITGDKAEGRSTDLNDWVLLASWATPRAEDAESAGMRHSRGVADTLTAQVALMGWATPRVQDIRGEGNETAEKRRGSGGCISTAIQASLAAIGPGPIGFLLGPNGWTILPASGQLDPAHSRWMMGLPEAWDVAAIMASRSLKKKRRE